MSEIDTSAIEAQTEAVSNLALGVDTFTEEFRHNEELREEFRKRERRVTVFLLVFLLVVIAVAAGGLVRLNAIADSNHRNNAIIKDCVEPTGVCYKRNAEQTNKTVLLIIDSNHNGKPDTQEILDAINAANKNGR